MSAESDSAREVHGGSMVTHDDDVKSHGIC